jgi:hypothetical protein
MAIFGSLGDLYTVSHISGPTHVWLGIAFSKAATASPQIVMRPAIGGSDHGSVDAQRIISAVVDGAIDAHVNIFPQRIEYIADDSPCYDVYRESAKLLAERVELMMYKSSRPGSA